LGEVIVGGPLGPGDGHHQLLRPQAPAGYRLAPAPTRSIAPGLRLDTEEAQAKMRSWR
jgi:hypothetical protein